MLKNLKKLRTESGISQRELAENIGVSQQSINKYENHNIEPDIETLIRMADFFDTSVDYLVGHSRIRRRIEPVSTYDLNKDEATVMDGFRQLNRKQRKAISQLIESFHE